MSCDLSVLVEINSRNIRVLFENVVKRFSVLSFVNRYFGRLDGTVGFVDQFFRLKNHSDAIPVKGFRLGCVCQKGEENR